MLRVLSKAVRLGFDLLRFSGESRQQARTARDPSELRLKRVRLTSQYSGRCLEYLGISVHSPDFWRGFSIPDGTLVVCNHLSYLDVLILASRIHGVFVTSQETREDPFLGRLAEAGGCLFVERRSKSALEREINAVADLLRAGITVIVFPEATSSDGTAVLPFKAALFEAAVRAQAPVQLLCLRYEKVNGRAVTAGSRDSLYWYGDMTFFSHLFRFFRLKKVEVNLRLVECLGTTAQSCRKGLSAYAHAKVASAYQ